MFVVCYQLQFLDRKKYENWQNWNRTGKSSWCISTFKVMSSTLCPSQKNSPKSLSLAKCNLNLQLRARRDHHNQINYLHNLMTGQNRTLVVVGFVCSLQKMCFFSIFDKSNTLLSFLSSRLLPVDFRSRNLKNLKTKLLYHIIYLS